MYILVNVTLATLLLIASPTAAQDGFLKAEQTSSPGSAVFEGREPDTQAVSPEFSQIDIKQLLREQLDVFDWWLPNRELAPIFEPRDVDVILSDHDVCDEFFGLLERGFYRLLMNGETQGVGFDLKAAIWVPRVAAPEFGTPNLKSIRSMGSFDWLADIGSHTYTVSPSLLSDVFLLHVFVAPSEALEPGYRLERGRRPDVNLAGKVIETTYSVVNLSRSKFEFIDLIVPDEINSQKNNRLSSRFRLQNLWEYRGVPAISFFNIEKTKHNQVLITNVLWFLGNLTKNNPSCIGSIEISGDPK